MANYTKFLYNERELLCTLTNARAVTRHVTKSRDGAEYLEDFFGSVSTLTPTLSVVCLIIKEDTLTDSVLRCAVGYDVYFVKADTCKVLFKPSELCSCYKLVILCG